ncbi:hypothetical protein DNHGIG_33300 [Collibacillus ludicampi]|uniref:GapA-binding peptide SR1P n=1 Tax=Collibacillus ludicampi TaxID=2771369 RepID=A0AAV4LJ60_9BACL|nr:hypothetical protein DNHGIG_33300 [Collibacillus ludicampi]
MEFLCLGCDKFFVGDEMRMIINLCEECERREKDLEEGPS